MTASAARAPGRVPPVTRVAERARPALGHRSGVITFDAALEPAVDACPMCSAELGRARGATRRQPLLTAVPGVFRWRCPDCAGIWQVRSAAPAPDSGR